MDRKKKIDSRKKPEIGKWLKMSNKELVQEYYRTPRKEIAWINTIIGIYSSRNKRNLFDGGIDG